MNEEVMPVGTASRLKALEAENAKMTGQQDALACALLSAREVICMDRQCLADTHMDPTSNEVDDDGKAWLAYYDEVLAEIEAALAKAGPAMTYRPILFNAPMARAILNVRANLPP